MSKVLTEKEYVAKDGNVCPVCQSKNILTNRLSTAQDYASRLIECSDCGSYWEDFYQLTRYEFLYDAIENEEVLE